MAGYSFDAITFPFDTKALAEVERLAADCLRAGFVSFDSLMSMSALLPADTVQGPSGKPVEPQDPKAFTSGAFVHLNDTGLRSNFRVFPMSTSLLARVLAAQFPGRMFSSVGLFFNLRAPVLQTTEIPVCTSLSLNQQYVPLAGFAVQEKSPAYFAW